MSLSNFLKKHKRKLLALGLAGVAAGSLGSGIHSNLKLKKLTDQQNKLTDQNELKRLKRQSKIESLGFQVAHQLIRKPMHGQLNRAANLGRKMGTNITPEQEMMAHGKLYGQAAKTATLTNLGATIGGHIINRLTTGSWRPQTAKDMRRYLTYKRIGQTVGLLGDTIRSHRGYSAIKSGADYIAQAINNSKK